MLLKQITVLSFIAATLFAMSARPQDIHKAIQQDELETVRDLLAENPDLVNARHLVGGTTPLHTAVLKKNNAIVQLLIDQGGDIDGGDTFGLRPLHYAYLGNSPEIAALLVERGANVNIKSVEGSIAPLNIVAMTGSTQHAALLLEHGADVEVTDSNGMTPFLMAVNEGRVEMADFLANQGANVRAADDGGVTGLHVAAIKNNAQLLRWFYDKGCEINAQDRTGLSPLHRASIAGYESMVQDIIAIGADTNLKDKNGHSPLYYAGKYGHKKVAERLIKQGAKEEKIPENFRMFDFTSYTLQTGEARIWYLGHCGWAVNTKRHFLIFDYYQDEKPADNPMLANGHINPDEIGDLRVLVFVSHDHRDHYDRIIHDWEDRIDDMKIVFGWSKSEDSKHVYMGPRQKRILDDIEIECVHSPESRIEDANFLIRIDGLSIYHSGDYNKGAGSDTFLKDMDFLSKTVGEIDLFFIRAIDNDIEEILIALEKNQPRYMFPMHAGGCEYRLISFEKKVEERRLPIHVIRPEHQGDRYIYKRRQVREISEEFLRP